MTEIKQTDAMIEELTKSEAKFVLRALIAAGKVSDSTIRACIELTEQICIYHD